MSTKSSRTYLELFLLPLEIIFDDWKARQAPVHAIFRRFSSVLRRVELFISLLQIFEFVY